MSLRQAVRKIRKFEQLILSKLRPVSCLSATLLVLVVQLLLPCGTETLKWTNFSVPKWVVEGSDVLLSCQFDVQSDLLYSVKWYKQGREFYRFVPAESIRKAYPLPGVIVDKDRSGAQHVTLRNARRESAGRYKCEVLAEAPNFRTLVMSGEMNVVQLPKGNLSVSGGREFYSPGTNVSLNCSAPHSQPPVELTWYINDQQAPQEYLVYYNPDEDIHGSASPRLGLHFIAQRGHFPTGELRLNCTAVLHELYSENFLHRSIESAPRAGDLFAVASSVTDWQLNTLFIVVISTIFSVF